LKAAPFFEQSLVVVESLRDSLSAASRNKMFPCGMASSRERAGRTTLWFWLKRRGLEVSTNGVIGTKKDRRRHRSWPESLKREIVAATLAVTDSTWLCVEFTSAFNMDVPSGHESLTHPAG
jgi:hypothetical protein